MLEFFFTKMQEPPWLAGQWALVVRNNNCTAMIATNPSLNHLKGYLVSNREWIEAEKWFSGVPNFANLNGQHFAILNANMVEKWRYLT